MTGQMHQAIWKLFCPAISCDHRKKKPTKTSCTKKEKNSKHSLFSEKTFVVSIIH